MLRVCRAAAFAVALVASFVRPLSAGAQSTSYDALGRLTGETYSTGNSITYAYDAAGNRTTVSVSVPVLTFVGGNCTDPGCVNFFTFQGNAGDYSFTPDAVGGITVVDSVPNRDGTYYIINITALIFKDQEVFTLSADGASIGHYSTDGLMLSPV